jgi:hypothetical protein
MVLEADVAPAEPEIQEMESNTTMMMVEVD